MTTVRAFTFDPSDVHAVRRCSEPALSFDSAAAGALITYDLAGGPFPPGSTAAITIDVAEISGIAPGLFFSGGDDVTDPGEIDAVGDGQVANLTFYEECAQIQQRAVTGTLAKWPKITIDITLPE